MGLTSEDKSAVLDSWAKMSGPTFQDAGEKVFLLLLKTDSTKALFPKFRDIPYDKLAGHPDVRDHGGKVIQVLDDFIKGLDTAGDAAVQKVGLLHKGVGVSHENIDLMKPVLLTLLGEVGCSGAAGAWENLWAHFMDVHRTCY